MMQRLIDRLLAPRIARIQEAERDRFRRLIGQVMERHESPAVLLAVGQLLELLDEEYNHDGDDGEDGC
jgi:hypothetical protein